MILTNVLKLSHLPIKAMFLDKLKMLTGILYSHTNKITMKTSSNGEVCKTLTYLKDTFLLVSSP